MGIYKVWTHEGFKNNVDNAEKKEKSLLIKFHFFRSGRMDRHFLKSDDVEDDIDRIP